MPSAPTPVASAAPTTPAVRGIALPGIAAPAFLDYIAYEPAHGRLWVPVGNDGSVDVLDVQSGSFTHIAGFKTAEREVRGKKRMMGPSAAAVGDGVVYIGDRASNEICPVDVGTLKPAACLALPSPTDGVAYVASAKEVWVTTPKDNSLTVLDASKPSALKTKTVIRVEGAPEGFAVDATRSLFFTNLEDKDKTLAIDLQTHKVKSTWQPACGSEGPRGVAVDAARGFVIVACTDHVQVLDAGHDGAPLGKLDAGGGIDNIEWLEARHLLYVGAAKAAKLVVARIDDKGQLSAIATVPTAEGARNAIADASGTAYLTDAQHAQVLVVPLPQ
jgi:DNA-binding beta-propeller fold protein YncE